VGSFENRQRGKNSRGVTKREKKRQKGKKHSGHDDKNKNHVTEQKTSKKKTTKPPIKIPINRRDPQRMWVKKSERANGSQQGVKQTSKKRRETKTNNP